MLITPKLANAHWEYVDRGTSKDDAVLLRSVQASAWSSCGDFNRLYQSPSKTEGSHEGENPTRPHVQRSASLLVLFITATLLHGAGDMEKIPGILCPMDSEIDNSRDGGKSCLSQIMAGQRGTRARLYEKVPKGELQKPSHPKGGTHVGSTCFGKNGWVARSVSGCIPAGCYPLQSYKQIS